MPPRAPWHLLVASLAACSGAADRPGAASVDARVDRVSGFDDLPAAFDQPPAPDASAQADAADEAAAPDDAPPGAYPAGPYGTAVGQTLADMRLEGFVNPTAEGLASARPFTPTSMAALRGAGRGYGVVFIAEFL